MEAISAYFSVLLGKCRCCHSVAQSCPVLHHFPEFSQTRFHWVSDAIQPSHLLSPSYPLTLNHSQHHNLFQWVGSLYQVAKALELQQQSIFFSEFQLFNTVLPTVVTMLYIRASVFICLVAESLYLFTNLSLFSTQTNIYLFPVVQLFYATWK